MFTGIISHLGTFIKQAQEGLAFVIPLELAKQVTAGSSIAIDGVCLTVNKINRTTVYVAVMPETLKKTTFKNLKPKALVNLELPAKANTFLAGHIIQGHIDGVAKLQTITKQGNSRILNFSLSHNLSKYIVEKGSIAVNGISLTVISTSPFGFAVGIVPYTWDNTILHTTKVGDFVNIEVDVLAKYVENLLRQGGW